jgi:hypothetical protein
MHQVTKTIPHTFEAGIRSNRGCGRRLHVVWFILFLPSLSPHLSLAKDRRKIPKRSATATSEGELHSFEKEVTLEELAKSGTANQILHDHNREYVTGWGQNLARNSDVRLPFTIKVLDSEEVNAFTSRRFPVRQCRFDPNSGTGCSRGHGPRSRMLPRSVPLVRRRVPPYGLRQSHS